MDKGEWNATIIKGDLATEITKLKEQPDGHTTTRCALSTPPLRTPASSLSPA